jgi:hypothetical protein
MDEQLQQETVPEVSVPQPAMPDVSGGGAPPQPPPVARPDVMGPNGGYQATPSEVPPQPQQGGIKQYITQAAGSLLGGSTPRYSRDATGNLQVEHVPDTPGSLFRRVLAASILGGAIGSESGPSGVKGFFRGAQAVGDKLEQRDAQARQQADQDFLARQKVEAAKREQERLGFEKQRVGFEADANARAEQAMKYATAKHNLDIISTQQQIQGKDWEAHEHNAADGRLNAAKYAAVESPAYTVGETEMDAIKKADPGAMKYLWFPVGTRTYTYKDADGKTQTGHENVMAAYNPDVNVALTADEAAKYNKVGVQLRDEKTGAEIPLKAGYQLNPANAALLRDQYAEKVKPFQDAENRELERRKVEATIKNLNAEAGMHYAQAVKAGRENAKDKKADAVEAAQKAFESNAQQFGIDQAIEKLSFGEKSVLADYYRPVAVAQETAIRDRSNEIDRLNKEIGNAFGDEKAKLVAQRDAVYQEREAKIRQVQAIDKLANSAFGVKPPEPGSKIDTAIKVLSGYDKTQQAKFVDSDPATTPEEKAEIKKRLGITTAAPTKSTDSGSAFDSAKSRNNFAFGGSSTGPAETGSTPPASLIPSDGKIHIIENVKTGKREKWQNFNGSVKKVE